MKYCSFAYEHNITKLNSPRRYSVTMYCRRGRKRPNLAQAVGDQPPQEAPVPGSALTQDAQMTYCSR